jgi:hypothetical protein
VFRIVSFEINSGYMAVNASPYVPPKEEDGPPLPGLRDEGVDA